MYYRLRKDSSKVKNKTTFLRHSSNISSNNMDNLLYREDLGDYDKARQYMQPQNRFWRTNSSSTPYPKSQLHQHNLNSRSKFLPISWPTNASLRSRTAANYTNDSSSSLESWTSGQRDSPTSLIFHGNLHPSASLPTLIDFDTSSHSGNVTGTP